MCLQWAELIALGAAVPHAELVRRLEAQAPNHCAELIYTVRSRLVSSRLVSSPLLSPPLTSSALLSAHLCFLFALLEHLLYSTDSKINLQCLQDTVLSVHCTGTVYSYMY